MFTIHQKRVRRAKKARAHQLQLKTFKAPLKTFTMIPGPGSTPKNSDRRPSLFDKARNWVNKLFAPRGFVTAGRAR